MTTNSTPEAAPYFRAFTPRFRGEIWEDSPGVEMGRGYSNSGKPFDITTAYYTRIPFQTYRRTRSGKFVIKAAVQTLKTYFMERCMAYEIQHEPSDARFYLCDADDAHDHAKGRLMGMLKGIPGIQGQIDEIASRHDVTTMAMYFPGMTFTVQPLNESSTQRVTLRYVKISDAWLARRNGMIRHALARTTQHPHDKKIIIESQGSEAGDDFDFEWESTDKRELHVTCPLCGKSQPFEWERERDHEFIPTPPLNIPSLDRDAWIAEWAVKLKAEDRRYAGMQKGYTGAPGELNEKAIMAGTHYECYHCGGSWPDKPSVRQALDLSSHYVATNPHALPENIGFTWPSWINQRIPWGTVMLKYLKAKRADEQLGNRLPLIEWYQKDAAKQWREDLAESKVRVDADMSYDPKIEWTKEWRRIGIIDVQIHASHFWVSFDAIASDGESRQLQWGCFTSFDEIESAQKLLRIQHNRVWIDYGHESELVKSECFKRGKFYKAAGERRETWHGWNMLTSSKWPDFWRIEKDAKGNVLRRYKDIVSEGELYALSIEGRRREIFRWNFSALACGDMFRRHRDGDKAPRSQFLPEPAGSEKNELSHIAQIHGRHRLIVVDKATGKKVPRWLPKHQTRPDHGFAIGQMRMAVYRIWNLGTAMPVEPNASITTKHTQT